MSPRRGWGPGYEDIHELQGQTRERKTREPAPGRYIKPSIIDTGSARRQYLQSAQCPRPPPGCEEVTKPAEGPPRANTGRMPGDPVTHA